MLWTVTDSRGGGVGGGTALFHFLASRLFPYKTRRVYLRHIVFHFNISGSANYGYVYAVRVADFINVLTPCKLLLQRVFKQLYVACWTFSEHLVLSMLAVHNLLAYSRRPWACIPVD